MSTDFLSMTATQVEALPEPQAAEVLGAWVKARRAELPLAVAGSASKPHAKLAKKALYQLQSTGVAVEEARPAAPTAPAEEPKNDFQGVISGVLGTGDRALFFATPRRGGGLDTWQGIVNDEFGLVQIERAFANRGAYRQRMKQLAAGQGGTVAFVSFERMQVELGRALTRNERTQTELNAEVRAELRRLDIHPLPAEVELPALEAGDEATREAGAALHDTVEIGQWHPSEAHLAALTARVEALKALPLPPEERREKAHKEARAACAEHFDPAMRARYAQRLWAMGEFFELTARPAQAQAARAEARRLAHETTPSRFAERLFEKAVEVALAAPARPPMPAPR